MASRTRAEPVPSTTSLRGFVIVLASTVMLAMTGILVKSLLVDYHMEPLALAFWRVLIVTGALALALLLFKRSLFQVRSEHVRYFAVLGLVGVGLHQLLWVTSVNLNGAGVATVLVYGQPTLVALISVRFLGETLDRTKIIALVLTLTGIFLVSRVYDLQGVNVSLPGIAAGVGTAFTWALYALLGRYTSRRYSAWTSLLYAFFFGTLFLLPLQIFVRDVFSLDGNLAGWGVLFFLALGPTLGGFALYTIGLSQVPASVVALIATFEPVLTIVMAYFLFGEQLELPQIAGSALILFSVLLLRPRGETLSPDP
jgi:drug/metabolite transporter (DMT)-like permease